MDAAPNQCLYRTGDAVRTLPDGRLIFIGRIDNQIKVRGFRIEPEEIEQLINQHPHIKQSVVVAKQGPHHLKYLTVYLVSDLQVERLPIHLPCLLQVADNPPVSLSTDNISCGGLALNDVHFLLSHKQKVQVRLRLPDMPKPIFQTAEVSWQKDQQAGLKFIEYDQETYSLCEHIESMLHNQGFIKALQRNVVDELRTMLKAKLPDYMLPENYTFLDELPLTANRKADRKALMQLDHEQLIMEDNEHGFTAPRTPIQQQLANIWQHLLQIKRISIHDNFFALGGNSLAAMQAINQISEVFQVEANNLSLFNLPTLANQAELIEQATKTATAFSLPPVRSTEKNIAPLSYSQQQIWVLNQMMLNIPLYNEPCTLHLGSLIEVKVLERCLNEIRGRHAILRTNFVEKAGELLQVVHPFMPETLSMVDLSILPEASQVAIGQQVFTEMLKKPFDLTQDNLFRCFLLRLNEHDNRLCMAMHHIVFDGVSMQILFDELETLYIAFLQKKSSPLPKLTVQYVDFALWQQQYLNQAAFAQDLAYWQQHLKDCPRLELMTDYSRSVHQTFAGAKYILPFSTELSQAIQVFSQQHGVTLFMTLYSVFCLLLSRYSRQHDVVINTVTATRSRDMDRTIGYFLNTLVLRLQLQGEESFIQLLQRAKNTILSAHKHQALPFAELVKTLRPERNYNANPFSQISFTVEPPIRRSASGWSISQVDVHNGTAKSDLTVEIDDLPTHLIARFEYSTELFESRTIEHFAGHFQHLITQILQNPHSEIQNLPIVTPAEHAQLLAWTQTQQPFPDTTAAHYLFEAQVQRTPQAIALCFEEQQLTYEQLNGLANQLAHHLQKQGIGSETLVGICVERSPSMIICLLAILKAGGAFLPLDASYPKARLNFMLNDAAVNYLLIESHLTHLFAEVNHSVQLIDVAEARLASVQEPWNNPMVQTTAQQLAYVIYTSGSTGKPKGVMLQHRGLCNLAVAQIEQFKLTPDCRILQFAAFCFDAAISEIFTTLLSGASLYLASKQQLIPGSPLAHFLKQHRITTITLAPSALAMLPNDMPLDDLHTLIVAGEACPLALAQHWVTGRRFYNAYGPTETTVCATLIAYTETIERMTIGYPIQNVELYVLDSAKQLVPIGVAGELYIGGVGLACGYLKRPELNAERFIDNPFSTEQTAAHRLYKTGDLVRYLPDGQLEFLGRIDQQVKLRGYRIELGEIEAVLRQHPQIRDCVVVPHAQPEMQQLIAYVLLEQTLNIPAKSLQVGNEHIQARALDTHEWREYLQQHLPDYMLPSHYISLNRFPVSSTGKLDRKNLPMTEVLNQVQHQHYIAPRSALELQLVKIWEDTLNKYPISVTDDFFELGGYSLLAIKLFATIKAQLGHNLPMSVLFQNNTVERLAALLGQHYDSVNYWSVLVPIQPQGTRPPLFCVPGMGGNVVYFHEIARSLSSEQPLYGFQARGLDGQQLPLETIPEMATLYIEEMRKLQPVGPYYLAGHSMGSLIAFEMAKQLEALGETVPVLFIMDTPALFNPKTPEELQWDDAQWLSQIAFAMELISGESLVMGLDKLRSLTPEEQLHYFHTRLKRVNLLPENAGLEQLRAIVQVFKTNELAIMRYSLADSCYAGQLVLLSTAKVYDDVLGILGEISADAAWGWQRVSKRRVMMHLVPGDHRTMLLQPHVQVLAEKMHLYLQNA